MVMKITHRHFNVRRMGVGSFAESFNVNGTFGHPHQELAGRNCDESCSPLSYNYDGGIIVVSEGSIKRCGTTT